MKRIILIISILCATAFAQQSPLGLHYPFGLPDRAVTGASSALGGGGTAVIEEQFGTALNPANAAVKDRSIFAALVSFDYTNITDDGNSSTVDEYAPKILSLILPVGSLGNLAFGMQRRYSANLNFLTEDIERLDDHRERYSAIELQRNGGLTAWQIGWAYKLNNGVTLGLQYERHIYSMDASDALISEFRYFDTASVNTGSFRTSIIEEEEVRFGGDGIRVGMQIPVHEKVTVGFAAEYVFNSDKNGEYTRIISRSDNLDLDSLGQRDTIAGKFTVELPPSIIFGVAYQHNPRLLFVADLQSTLWDIWEGEYTFAQFEPRNTYGVSFGARFVPAGSRIISRYSEKIHYSAGVNFATLPNGDSHEYSMSIGAGLPIPNEGGMIDIVFGIGRRTDSGFDKYAENIVRLQLGINGGRTWYQRPDR